MKLRPDTEIRYTIATEPELNDLLAGRPAGDDAPWPWGSSLHVPIGSVGVVWRRDSGREKGDLVHPLILVCRENDQRRLCGRFAQLRSDLSPLTVWCHLLTPQYFETADVRSLTCDADLGGYQAAWTGLIVAEALLLAERSIAKLRIAACLATQSFSVARAQGLWNHIPLKEVLNRFDSAQRVFRSGEPRLIRLRTALDPIWASLADAGKADVLPARRELSPIVRSLRQLQRVRSIRDKGPAALDEQEVHDFVDPLGQVAPEVDALRKLPSLTPEKRLQQFDKLVQCLDETDEQDLGRRVGLAMAAGYLTTVAAGGATSLGLAEAKAQRWPEITAWAYVIGGIGERVVWTSSFDGLGRLVARELMRPLRLDDSPTCDLALDEALILVDPQLSDPLVHLRLKQGRVVSVAILPGVNVAISIAEASEEARRSETTRHESLPEALSSRGSSNALAVLADAIWPYLFGVNYSCRLLPGG